MIIISIPSTASVWACFPPSWSCFSGTTRRTEPSCQEQVAPFEFRYLTEVLSKHALLAQCSKDWVIQHHHLPKTLFLLLLFGGGDIASFREGVSPVE
jgi:hypothetical protein